MNVYVGVGLVQDDKNGMSFHTPNNLLPVGFRLRSIVALFQLGLLLSLLILL